MTDDPFAAPEKSIRWAREAVEQIQAGYAEYPHLFEGRFENHFDVLSGRNIHKFHLDHKPPEKMEKDTTAAILNAKNAFDQTVYSAARIILGRPPKGNTYFPWRQSPSDLERYITDTKNREIPEPLWDTLRAHEPYPVSTDYKGGNSLLREIAALANNKHTIGLTCVASCKPWATKIYECGPDYIFRPEPWNYEKNELVLGSCYPHVDSKVYYGVVVDVVLDVTGDLRQQPAIGILRQFVAKAEQVLADMRAITMGG